MAVVRFDNLFSLLCSVSQGKYACSLFVLLLRYFPFFSCLNVSFYGNHKWGCHRVGLCLPFTDNVKGHLWWFKREWPLLGLMYLNAWSPVGEIVWRELGSVSLVGRRVLLGVGFENWKDMAIPPLLSSPLPHPLSSPSPLPLCLLSMVQNVSLQLFLLPCLFSVIMSPNPLKPYT